MSVMSSKKGISATASRINLMKWTTSRGEGVPIHLHKHDRVPSSNVFESDKSSVVLDEVRGLVDDVTSVKVHEYVDQKDHVHADREPHVKAFT